MLATRICEEWLYSTFAADAEIMALVGTRIFAYSVKGTTPIPIGTPYILYAKLSAYDVMGVGPTILMSNLIYIVRGVVEIRPEGGSFEPLEPIANRIHTLIHGQRGDTPDGQVLACVREGPYALPENAAGRAFLHLGGTYRMYTIP